MGTNELSIINCPKCRQTANQRTLYLLKEWWSHVDVAAGGRALTLVATTYNCHCVNCGHSYGLRVPAGDPLPQAVAA
jgi:hypothetical protein